MPITVDRLHAVTQRIPKESECEVERRHAASRHYYSFYHFANHFADQVADVPPSVQRGPTHKNLSDFYGRGAAPGSMTSTHFRQLGILLRQCHLIRCEADYELASSFEQHILDQQLKDCDKGVNILKHHLSST